jgi:crossover junction endodeoxyribonuclease RuvC
MPYRVYGLDCSLTGTGVSDGADTWLVNSKGYKTDTVADRARRLLKLVAGILGETGSPNLVVIEGPAFASVIGHMHDRSGLWWLIVAALHERQVPIAEVPPTALKKYATGKGNANKGAVIDATSRRFPSIETYGDDNRCDALWLAAMGHEVLGQPLVTLPAAQRAATLGVRWPEVSR